MVLAGVKTANILPPVRQLVKILKERRNLDSLPILFKTNKKSLYHIGRYMPILYDIDIILGKGYHVLL